MISGILNIYKEQGYTSHDVVACLRKITGQKKIGHTGTLDPDATGVLPVCLGRATKLCDMLTDRDKTYEAVLLLGRTTDTQDVSGKILEEHSTEELQEDAVKECILGFAGEYDQIPPMYSAVKVNGRKLCELAREGKTIERKSRRVQIHEIRIIEMELPRVRMEITCSKGTYIRTLCSDIGDRLGTGGCMENLIRTRVGRFDIRDSVRLDEARDQAEQGRIEELVIPLEEMFSDLKAVVLDEEHVYLAYNGNSFQERDLAGPSSCGHGETCRVYDKEGRFIAVYQYDDRKRQFRIVKMFLDQEELPAKRRARKG